MAPEYGATCGFFPIDERRSTTCGSPAATRSASRWSRPMPRSRACGATTSTPDPVFTDTLELDLGDLEPSLAGPKRPQDRVPLEGGQAGFEELPRPSSGGDPARAAKSRARYELDHGDVVIAAITSCTNTSNPGVMIGAGLIAKKAVEHGLQPSPGSRPRWRRARAS